MAPKPLTYKERDVRQAISALGRAGLPVKLLEIDKDGKISLHVGVPHEKTCHGGDSNDNADGEAWDRRLEELEKQRQDEQDD